MAATKPTNSYTLRELMQLTGYSKRQVRYFLEKHNVRAKARNTYGEDALKTLAPNTYGEVQERLTEPDEERLFTSTDPLKRSISALEALGETLPEPASRRAEHLASSLKQNHTLVEHLLEGRGVPSKPETYPVLIRLRPGVTVEGQISKQKFEQLLDLMENE